MEDMNKLEQEHMAACDRVSVLEKEYIENPSQSAFDAMIAVSADLVSKGHKLKLRISNLICNNNGI